MPKDSMLSRKPGRQTESSGPRTPSGIAGFGGAQNARWALRIEPSLAQAGLPGDEWPARLERAAREVFAAFAAPRPPDIDSEQDDSYAEVAAAVGMAGALWAELSVNCSPQAARRIASGMLGLPRPSREQIAVAIGEITSRIARQIRALYVRPADQCIISPPVSLASPNAADDWTAEGHSYLAAVGFESLPVWIRLSLQA